MLCQSGESDHWKKKACGIILGDQTRRRALLVDVVGVENHDNTLRALRYAKEKYNLQPKIVTSDLSPNVIAPIRQLFGEKVLQIDGYHVMQELNKGIRRDLLDYRTQLFGTEIRELLALRRRINRIQQEIKITEKCSKIFLKTIPKVNPSHHNTHCCFAITKRVLPLITIDNPNNFMSRLQQVLRDIDRKSQDAYHAFTEKIRQKLPKGRMTLKGMKRLKIELLQKLKKLYLTFRSLLEAESIQFHKNYWFLFIQPEKLSKGRLRPLNDFLAKYPSLQEYRDMTLLVGEIYRKSIHDIDGHQIDDLIIKPYYSKNLQTAIKTIKKHKPSILRFVEVFKEDPTLARSCRANMEFFNKRFKAPFQHGLNRTKQAHLLAKLQLQLGCEIRFFSENKVST